MKLKYTDRSLEDIDNAVDGSSCKLEPALEKEGNQWFQLQTGIRIGTWDRPPPRAFRFATGTKCLAGPWTVPVANWNPHFIHSVFDNRQYPDKMP